MYSIVEIKGHQYKVQVGDVIDVDKFDAKVNDEITLDRVLFSDGKVGTPTVATTVTAKVIRQARDRKIIVLKRKPGKYVKKNGHRTHYTCLEITAIGGSTKKAKAAPAKKAPAKKKAAPKATGADDLTKIEGIGPKISEILINNGITTFAQLAASTPETISGFLAEAGNRFKSHNPGTWPDQSKMAADGKWDELKKWQDELDGGR